MSPESAAQKALMRGYLCHEREIAPSAKYLPATL